MGLLETSLYCTINCLWIGFVARAPRMLEVRYQPDNLGSFFK